MRLGGNDGVVTYGFLRVSAMFWTVADLPNPAFRVNMA